MSHFGDARVQDVPRTARSPSRMWPGADEEKEELREIVEFLRQPDKYLALGARIPKGVLLVALRAPARPCWPRPWPVRQGVKFLSISGSDFVEMYVGVGASRVRDLFHQAKKNSPPSSSSTRSTPWAAREAAAWAAATTSGSRP